MKIAVCAKQIPDPANPIEYSNGNVVRPDEQVLDDTDRYGIEVALQLKEKRAEIVDKKRISEITKKISQKTRKLGGNPKLFQSMLNLNQAHN